MRLDAVGEPAQAGAAVRSAPPTPSSATSTTSFPFSPRGADRRARGVARAWRRSQRLGGDEVGGRLDLGREALGLDVHRDRERRRVRQRVERGGEAVLGEDRRVNAARELAQLVDRDL